MEQILEHYGKAILVATVLILLGIIIGYALASDSYVAQEFKEAIVGFFDRMFALVPENSP